MRCGIPITTIALSGFIALMPFGAMPDQHDLSTEAEHLIKTLEAERDRLLAERRSLLERRQKAVSQYDEDELPASRWKMKLTERLERELPPLRLRAELALDAELAATLDRLVTRKAEAFGAAFDIDLDEGTFEFFRAVSEVRISRGPDDPTTVAILPKGSVLVAIASRKKTDWRLVVTRRGDGWIRPIAGIVESVRRE